MKQALLFLVVLFSVAFTHAQVPDNENLRITHGPWLQNMGESGLTVMWTTNKSAVPSVIISDEKGNTRIVRNSTDGIIDGGGVLHKVRINGLEAGTRYKYKPVSVEITRYQPYRIYYGDTLARDEYSFTTIDSEKNSSRALVVNDIHENNLLLSQYLEAARVKRGDLVFMNGDMIDYLQEEKQIFDGFLDTSVESFAKEIPFYLVRGNHETRGMLARDFKDYFDFPENRFYYALSDGPVHYVLLDCGEDKPDNNRYYFGLADYDTYRLNQLEWLKEHIKSPEFRNARYRVVIVHMPIIGGEDMGHGMQDLSDHFGPVLKDAGISLLLAGHTHRVKYYEGKDSGFGYPVLVSSNKTYIELEASERELKAVLKNSAGENILEKSF
jgi:predicted phosphodiesterase